MAKIGSVIKQFDDFTQWLEGYSLSTMTDKEFEVFMDKVSTLHDITGLILDEAEPEDEGEDEEA